MFFAQEDWWGQNWGNVLTALGTLIGVLGFIFGYYWYRKSLKEKLPCYAVISNNLFAYLHAHTNSVTVKFEGYGEPIQNLTVTKIAFWNAGKETINKADIPSADPIVFKIKEHCKILAVDVIERTTPVNEFEASKNQDRTQVKVSFKYLDKNQGAVIQVFHTGIGNDLTVSGTVIGTEGIKPARHNAWLFLVFLLVPIVSWGFLGGFVIRLFEDQNMKTIVNSFVAIISTLLGVYLGVYSRRIYPKWFGLTPKRFTTFPRE